MNTNSLERPNPVALQPQLANLQHILLTQAAKVNQWFDAAWQASVPPIYGSVDLRNAGFKIAPIDMNLFPAGFNNLNRHFQHIAVDAAKRVLAKLAPGQSNILLIPENHTRNLFYWANIDTLMKILQAAGFVVFLGSLDQALTEPLTIEFAAGAQVTLHPIQRVADKLQLAHFKPDIILLNNDLSDGIPSFLEHIQQPVIPPAKLGWSHRLKSDHFAYYAKVADEFAAALNVDAWLLAPLFRHCGKVDFMEQNGMDCVYKHAEALFAEINAKYQQYQIQAEPFLIIKADAGTYGMAVMTVRSLEELKNLNRKQRTRMSKIKGGQSVHSVIIQEGVYTIDRFGSQQAVAEPVVYLLGDTVIGGFYRFHPERAADENLNTPGMAFQPIAFPEPCHEPCPARTQNPEQDLYYMYGVIAKLSMLAAAREIKDQANA